MHLRIGRNKKNVGGKKGRNVFMYEILKKVYISSIFYMYILYLLTYICHVYMEANKMEKIWTNHPEAGNLWLNFDCSFHSPYYFPSTDHLSIHSFFKLIDATEWKEREYLDYILVKGVYLILFPCSYGIKPVLSMILLLKYPQFTCKWNLLPISMP